MASVPDGQAKHSIQAIQYFVAPLLVPVNDDFGIGICTKDVSVALQFPLQFRKVIDLSIKHNPNGLFLIRHGLVPAGEIDDRQPPESESKRARNKIPLVIRTSMADGFGHRFDVHPSNGRLISEVKLSANSTHKI